jgi:hypothetical protein
MSTPNLLLEKLTGLISNSLLQLQECTKQTQDPSPESAELPTEQIQANTDLRIAGLMPADTLSTT